MPRGHDHRAVDHTLTECRLSGGEHPTITFGGDGEYAIATLTLDHRELPPVKSVRSFLHSRTLSFFKFLADVHTRDRPAAIKNSCRRVAGAIIIRWPRTKAAFVSALRTMYTRAVVSVVEHCS